MSARVRGWVTSTRVSTNRYDLVSAATEDEAREIAYWKHHSEGQAVQVIGMTEAPYCEDCGSFSDEGNHNDPECKGEWSIPPTRDPSQTSAPVDETPDASLSAPTAPSPAVPTCLAASAPDHAADVAGTTHPHPPEAG